MVDTLSRMERSERMMLIRGENTGPEMVVRRLVHGMGFRYRLHVGSLPGKPDLVFSSRRKVIFVHGCFWHRHKDSSCKLARLPKSRLDFWRPKLEKNRSRDERVIQELSDEGWKVLTIWECELVDMTFVSEQIRSFLS
jgi:DNA mismatch endonuclease, patch repair protein